MERIDFQGVAETKCMQNFIDHASFIILFTAKVLLYFILIYFMVCSTSRFVVEMWICFYVS